MTGDDWRDQRKRDREESPDPQSSQGHVCETTGEPSKDHARTDATERDECAVPGCTRTPRRSCWTCADHMSREQEFTSAA